MILKQSGNKRIFLEVSFFYSRNFPSALSISCCFEKVFFLTVFYKDSNVHSLETEWGTNRVNKLLEDLDCVPHL